jgi:radical SAM family uncharacterized protein
MSLQDRIAPLLSQVEQPFRYIGGEAGQTVKPDARARIALVFPDKYELGMSNNALRVLYHVVNSDPRWAAERAFAPWPDFGNLLREHGVPLGSLESHRPLREFDVVGITLQTELNYTTIPYVLDLAEIPVWAADRGEDDPLVVGGGPCTANPEPIAPFFDAFVVGDGEVLVRSIMELAQRRREQGVPRAEILRQLAGLPGMYVPSLLPMEIGPHGDLVPAGIDGNGPYARAKGVRRTWVETLVPEDFPVRVPVPNGDVVHERFAIELVRGCTQGCRFCQAGYWYRPVRELAPDHVVEIAKKGLSETGSDELGLLSLSTADYSQILPLADRLVDDPAFRNVNLSLPSLRANMFGQNLARKVARARGSRSATFAPETGSQRLRRVINKTISDEDMYEAAEGVFSNGWHSIKLYTMIGLPTEDMADMDAFCGLIQGLAKVGARHTRRAEVHPNVGILVPKPHTPMQWEPYVGRDEAMERIRFVRERFRGRKHVRITWSRWDVGYMESLFARGDRQLAPMILEAARSGMVFESDEDSFRGLDAWKEIFARHGYDSDARVFRARDLDEVFPWDFIHAGATKGFLKEEWKRMRRPEAPEVPDCRWGACNHCGIPGNWTGDIKLAPTEPGQEVLPPPGTFAGAAKAGPAAGLPPEDEGRNRRDPSSLSRTELGRNPSEGGESAEGWDEKERSARGEPWLLRFSKTGLARFLSHHGTMRLLEKSLRRAGLKLFYSRGFSPRPRFKNAGALPVGLSSHSEPFLVELESAPADAASVPRLLSSFLPAGFEVVSFERSEGWDLPVPPTMTYRLEPDGDESSLRGSAERFGSVPLPEILDGRGRPLRAADEVTVLEFRDGGLELSARTNAAGNTASAYALLSAATGIPLEDLRRREVAKLA